MAELPNDPGLREYIADNLKEGLTPSGSISDWGDYEGDFTAQQSDRSNVFAENRDDDGLGFPTADEVQSYYDQLMPEDITIIAREDKG
jgi:hypothetical protein